MNNSTQVIDEHRLYIAELRAQLAERDARIAEELGDANERIAQLNGLLAKADARIAELEAAQRFIPVDERLPSDEEEGSLVWTNNGSDCNSYNYDIGFHHEKFGWLLSTEWEHGDPTVTHWMPLPPPPVTDVTP